MKRQVSEAILVGEWPAGFVLPNEAELARRFGVAVGTLRHALADLVAEGMLVRRRKTGTAVTGRTPAHSLRFFYRHFRLRGPAGELLRSHTQILSVVRTLADARQAAALELPAGTELVSLTRLRSVEGRPVMHEELSLPAARLPDFPERPEDVAELLYLYLLEHYGIRVTAVREQVTAELADAVDAARLDLALPAAVLAIHEVSFDHTGVPVVAGWHRAVTDKYCYINEIS
ncbi:GntR family transcriptional regulator [Faunimonas pinastri]|uniref:GntR family transcriptional regulator n=1 Tax=Faunimonas pinastri TaxID=1855383 RepID=UPI001EEB45B3|nr:GntR family transcriptional regulator [Faunimonas pinastri]